MAEKDMGDASGPPADDEGRQPPSYRDLFDVHPHSQYAHVMR